MASSVRRVRNRLSRSPIGILGLVACAFAGCDRLRPDRRDYTLPPIDEIRRIYRDNGMDGAITWDGNVVEIRARQPASQLQRGGSLWARVGPYVHLFNPGTKAVFDTYPGVAAVRAVTLTGSDREIARATLQATELSDILWRRTLNLLGHAVNEGTERPSLLLDLVQWGEQHTSFRYNPRYVPEAQHERDTPESG